MTRRRARRGEAGSVLPIALITVVVLATIVSAVASFEQVSLSAQTAVVERARVNLAADFALDQVVAALEDKTTAGVFNALNPPPGTDPLVIDPDGNAVRLQTCVDYPGQFPYRDDDFDADGDGDPANEVDVEVTCGAHPESGSPRGASGYPPDFVIRTVGGLTSHKVGDVLGIPTDSPYCENFQATSGGCEAGIYIAPGVNNDGGLAVASSGQPAGTALVQSNSSIVAAVTGLDRGLNVRGGVQVRRSCSNVWVNVDTTPSVADGAPSCRLDVGSASMEPLPVPDYHHELWPAVATAERDPETNAILPAAGIAELPSPADLALALVYRDPATWDRADPDAAGPLPAGNGFCSDGLFMFEPGYYRDLSHLNYLMTVPSCVSTTWWFMPGVYYFDFVDVGTSSTPYWREPVNFAQMVGGTPNGWVPGTAVAQPAKVMQPHRVDADAWGISRPGSDGRPADDDWGDPGETASSAGGDAQYARSVDDGGLTSELWFRPNGGMASISTGKLHTSMPTTPGVQLHSVKIRVKEDHDQVYAWYPQPASGVGFPRVKIEFSMTGVNGVCYLPVGRMHPDSSPNHLGTDTPRGEEFDLSLCVPGGQYATANFPATITPAMVNNLKLTFQVDRAGSQRPHASLDGMEVVVSYTGPPAPSYPRGCDPAAPGVQFIFGNVSRMAFAGNDTYLELCGTEGEHDIHALTLYGLSDCRPPTGDATCGATGYNSVPKPLVRSSGHAGVTTNVQAVSGFGTLDGPITLGNPIGYVALPTGFSSGATAQAWQRATDNTFAVSDPAWSGGLAATLDFALPDFVPAGSTLEYVDLRLRHAERGVSKITIDVTKGSAAHDASAPLGDPTASDYTMPAAVAIPVCSPPGCDSLTHATATSWVQDATASVLQDWTLSSMANTTERERLTAQLRNSTGVRGATVKLTVTPDTTSPTRISVIEGVELIVHYRPPGTLRPLRGCMTVRLGPGANPDDHLNVNATQNGAPYTTTTDSAYSGASGPTDVNTCPLFRAESQSEAQGTKVHISGVVFAPSAAIDLSGKDNEAPFVTDAILARTLRASRWKESPSVVAVGGGSFTERDPRLMRLDAYHDGTLVASAWVSFDDTDADPDEESTVVRWERRPVP